MNATFITAKYLKAIELENFEDYSFTISCLKKGILLDPFIKISEKTSIVLNKLYGVDLNNANSTFYQNFEVRKNISWEEVLFDRILHYSTTYGGLSEFLGGIYIPNSKEYDTQQSLKKYFTIIKAFNKDELVNKLESFISQPLALSTSDIKNLAKVINDYSLNIDYKYLSKELQIELSASYGYVPSNARMLIRTIVCMVTGKTELYKTVKDVKNFNFLLSNFEDKKNIVKLVKAFISKYGIQEIANHYRPNKKFWLIIRKIGLQKEINAVKKLSDKKRINHSFVSILEKFPEDLSSYNVYQLIRFYNYLQESLVISIGDIQLYRIRNGRVAVKEITKSLTKEQRILAKSYLKIIEEELANRYCSKEIKIFQPNSNIKIAMPTTGKTFIGAYPMFTSVKIPKDYQIGLYWNEKGDLDLHGHTFTGEHVGFNSESAFGLIYTGDMTALNKNGLAAEAILCEGREDVCYSVQPYSRLNSEACKIYIANSKNPEPTKVVSEEQLIFQACLPTDKPTTFAIGLQEKLILTNLSLGGIVPDDELSELIIHAVERKSNTAMSLEDFIKIVGAKFVTNKDEATHNFSSESISFASFMDLLKD